MIWTALALRVHGAGICGDLFYSLLMLKIHEDSMGIADDGNNLVPFCGKWVRKIHQNSSHPQIVHHFGLDLTRSL